MYSDLKLALLLLLYLIYLHQLQGIGLSLIAVIMHSPSSDIRFNEAQKLLNFGFSNFTNVSFGDKGDSLR